MNGECDKCHEHCLDCICDKLCDNHITKPEKSKLDLLKDLGLLGAIKDSTITSENYKDKIYGMDQR